MRSFWSSEVFNTDELLYGTACDGALAAYDGVLYEEWLTGLLAVSENWVRKLWLKFTVNNFTSW